MRPLPNKVPDISQVLGGGGSAEGDKDGQRSSARPEDVNSDATIYEDGNFWFNELIHESFNFDEEVLWPNIELLMKKRRLAEVSIPSETEVKAFVKMKIENSSQYKQDLQILEKKKREAKAERTAMEEKRP